MNLTPPQPLPWQRLTPLLLPLLAALPLLLASPRAEAFCGFYVSGASAPLSNNATMTVMMRSGRRTVLSMQNTYSGPPEDFAMVIPVPVVLKEQDVKTLPDELFAKVDKMASPRLVEYWEQDPCKREALEPQTITGYSYGFSSYGLGDKKGEPSSPPPPVRIEAQFKTGEYEIVVLSADDSSALDTWLRANRYNIPKGAEAVLRPYIEQGMYFFVAKVDIDKVTFKHGRAALSPLRFHYDTDTFSLPIRLGLLNAHGPQDLLVHILAPSQRYEVANYPNATLPTNLDVAHSVRNTFPAFVNALFDKTQQKTPGAVVTEYAWTARSCDPCPGPRLNKRDFATLGADVIPQHNDSFVLTRLHARYTRAQATEDLIFQPAPPITGGRERYSDDGTLEASAIPGYQNAFQARYSIRHTWHGPITCAEPQRATWGPSPRTYRATLTSTNAAQAPRHLPSLARALRTHVPELGLRAPWTIKDALKPSLRTPL